MQALTQPLVKLSARIGQDPLLTQAAGGNTSIKADGVLWVKASGKWLAEADKEPMFVPVDLAGVRRRIAAGEADPARPEVLEAPGVQGLRPSIETTLHALMPHPVVLHVHSVNTIAWAARADGESRIAQCLNGLNWAWVPYCRPGLPLTQAVARVMQTRNPDVLIIANHGPVLGAADCAAAEDLLEELERRLRLRPRAAPAPDLARLQDLARNSDYRLPKYARSHGMATDPVSLRIATGGSLYPDHVVFLGVGATELRLGEDFAAVNARCAAQGHGEPALLLIAGAGVLMRASLPAGAEEMVQCLADVTARIPEDAPVSYLTEEQNAELLDWDAEKYRRSLAAAR